MSAIAPRHEYPTIAGTRLHLQTAGEDGPPLLYLHGANGVSWLPGHERLAAHCRLLLPEHPGWSEDELAGGLEEMADLVYFYLDVLDALGLERVHLAGHSLGGWLAAELAVTQPHRFWTLTVIDAAGLWLADTPMPDLFALSPAESARLTNYDPALAAASVPANPTTEFLTVRARAKIAFARVSWNPYLHNPQLPSRLHRATMPSLVLWGEEDRVIPVAYAAEYARQLPDATVVRIPECGHSPAREKPDAFADALLGFLAERAPADARPAP